MTSPLMPLFPLNVVLFPQTDLPLHIFEDRYKRMIGDCLEARQEFGVILAQENSIESIGCASAITGVVKRYDDGRMDIVTRGTRRFEVLMLDREMPYLRAEPQFFDDEPSAAPLDDSRRMKAMELFAELQNLLGMEQSPAGNDRPELGHPQLSYQLMSRLPADLEFKQSLLQLRSEDERLARVIMFFDTVKTRLSRTIKARATASGNGKGR